MPSTQALYLRSSRTLAFDLMAAVGCVALGLGCEATRSGDGSDLFAAVELGDQGDEDITITGITYEFATRRLLADVEVSLQEYPHIRARSGPDGVYTLTGVPAWTRVTPRVRARDYRPMWQRTVDTTDSDIEMFYFQMVPDVVYHGFSVVLGVRPERRNCQIVTTVTDPYMAEVGSWEEFDAFLPHGQQGVEVDMYPAPAPQSGPVYFTDAVIPSWELTETSTDGGVLWVNVVPPADGIVTLKARSEDPTLEFESLTLSCEPGRLINASPPWGINTRRVD